MILKFIKIVFLLLMNYKNLNLFVKGIKSITFSFISLFKLKQNIGLHRFLSFIIYT
jgi:hypothetical protein